MPDAYVVALIQIENPGPYEAYAEGFDFEHFAGLGGEVLIVSDQPEEVEGSWDQGRLVVLKFPSKEKAKEWYDSDEYGAVKPIRHANSTSILAIHEGMGG